MPSPQDSPLSNSSNELKYSLHNPTNQPQNNTIFEQSLYNGTQNANQSLHPQVTNYIFVTEDPASGKKLRTFGDTGFAGYSASLMTPNADSISNSVHFNRNSLLPPNEQPNPNLFAAPIKQWNCVCGKIFDNYDDYLPHSKTHRPDERPHVCDQCHRGFTRRQDLKRHMAIHFRLFKPFQCPNCATTFTRTDALQRHIKAKRCQ
ncbi:hypothetical protein BC833DRAFT_561766 [Globomyces pollinis-pini]|nr:hypothetical protein BC833DRAFT_561766 [Globomyces pollinis-pini]